MIESFQEVHQWDYPEKLIDPKSHDIDQCISIQQIEVSFLLIKLE